MARNPREGYIDPRGTPPFPCCQHCPEYPDGEHNVYGIAGHALPCTRCTPTPGVPARRLETKGGYPAGNAPIAQIRKPPTSVTSPLQRLFGADANATLGMDPVRYVRHQRDECPADEPCALCMYEASEKLLAVVRSDRDGYRDAAANYKAGRAYAENQLERARASRDANRTGWSELVLRVDAVRGICADPNTEHAGSCASYRKFRTTDGPFPCDCIVSQIQRALEPPTTTTEN